MQDPRPDSTDDYAEDRYDNPATGIRARRWVLLLALTIFVGPGGFSYREEKRSKKMPC